MTALDLDAWDDEHPPDTLERIEEPDELTEQGAPPIVRWKAHDDAAADWCLRKLARVRKLKAVNLARAQAEHDRIERWLDAANTPLERDDNYFAGAVRDYANRRVRAELDATGDWSKVTKTLRLPAGTVKARRSTDGRFDLFDQAATVAFLEDVYLADRLVSWRPSITAGSLEDRIVRVHDGTYYVWAELICIDTACELIADGMLDVLGHPDDGEQPPDGIVAGWIPVPGVRRVGVGEITYTVVAEDGDQ